ncbi:MAG TPA: galactokinase [Gemmatimonadaceae bacterium]|nr:galactokinase [Gemmatimonadaceae bacterium]
MTDAVLVVFARQFGGVPLAVASAAGRVNLIGEHTDYNGGEVLPIGIGRRTYVAVRPRPAGEQRSRVMSADIASVGEFDVGAPQRVGAWWDYVAGVASQLRAARVELPQVDVAVWSNVPCGVGLSSSAALCVATTAALLAAAGHDWSARDIALVAHRAEVDFVGVPVGIMDQFASALSRDGMALHVWCDTTATEYAPFADGVLVIDTAVERSLRGSAYHERRAECQAALTLLRQTHPGLRTLAEAAPDQVVAASLPEPLCRRALHVAQETQRVGAAVAALRRGGCIDGELFTASHASLRDLYECSTPELDWVVDRAVAHRGVRGARMTGAGWGGCAIAVGDAGALADVAPELAADYEAAFGRAPRVWVSRAEGGVRVDLGG